MLNSSLLVLGCSMIFAVSAGMPLHAASSEKKENKTVASEDALPSLALDGLPDVWIQGTPVKEWEKDKVYIFEFWATWCGPCRKAIPELNEIAKQFSKDVVVIGISDEPVEKIKAMKEPVIEYYYGVDTKKTMDKILEIKGIPHVIIIDPKGIVRWEGFPLLENHKLTPEVVKNLIEKYK